MRPEAGRGIPGGSLTAAVLVTTGLAAAAALSWLLLRLDVGDLRPGRGGWQLVGEFFGAALRPALRFEGDFQGGPAAVFVQGVRAAGLTVTLAAAALSLSLVGGAVLGYLGSSLRWTGAGGRALVATVRLMLAVMRSVHELVWAVLLLAAVGMGPLVAVVAIAIPYTGVLARIFAEMVDETPPDAAAALAGAGASSLQAFAFGVLPRALPDMLSYSFYRFECALRSSAVLGFFGFPTLGYHIAASFENLHYREVWSYLYLLFALIVAVDWWSGRLRRELSS